MTANLELQETQDARRQDMQTKYSNCSLDAISGQCRQRLFTCLAKPSPQVTHVFFG